MSIDTAIFAVEQRDAEAVTSQEVIRDIRARYMMVKAARLAHLLRSSPRHTAWRAFWRQAR